MRRSQCFAAWIVLSLAAPAVATEPPIVYPAKGQKAEQQQKDQGECGELAKQTTGVDPLAVAESQTAQPEAAGPHGERVRGAARGAVAGAAIGAIAGDAGKGAGIGAATGTVAGGARTRRQARAEEAQVEGTRQKAQDDLDRYGRAYRACLEGRGYTLQ